jgi:hypothetical protein
VALGSHLAALAADLRQVFPYHRVCIFRHKHSRQESILAARFAVVKKKVKVVQFF